MKGIKVINSINKSMALIKLKTVDLLSLTVIVSKYARDSRSGDTDGTILTKK